MAKQDICCPKFEPKKWNDKTVNWKNKNFISDSVPALFHIPAFWMIGPKIAKMTNFAEKANATDSKKENTLILFHDPNAFKSQIYLSVTKKVPKVQNISLSGTFLSKVYAGPNHMIPKFVEQMDKYLQSKKKSSKGYYIHYAYCPQCEKKYGHQYMTFFAKIK